MPTLHPIPFEAGNVDITVSAPVAPLSIFESLLANKPFPDDAFVDDAIALGTISAAANKEFRLDKVKFSAGGDAFAGLGVYRSGEKLFAQLQAEGLDEPMVSRLDLPDLTTKNIYALRWGYLIKASAKGAVALGPTISFGASGKVEGFYGLLRVLDRKRKALDAINETIASWKVPRQIAVPSDLPVGSWVIAETDGEIKMNVGVAYGYDFNWVREDLTLGGLSGDFGLRIEMGVKAQLGFNASGRYAVVVGREDDSESLRLQIFKLRQQGWTFAFDAAVSAQVEQNLIPDNFKDFVRGVFNVNGHQALHDILKEFDKWTNPNKKLVDLLGAELVDYAKAMVKEVTGFDPDTDINKAIDTLRKPLELWRGLPHKVTSILYGLLQEKVPLHELRDFLQQVVTLADPQNLADAITDQLRRIDFFETPVGRWLTAIAEEGILSLLAKVSAEREKIAEIAQKTLALLDGSLVEDILRKLQTWIEEKLGLSEIINVIHQADFDKMDQWLKKRLSDFLGKSIVFEELEKIKGAINKVQAKADEFYKKGFQVLIEKYQAEFNYSYQKTTTRTALLDVTFDFAADAASAGKFFKQALNGNFNEILARQLPGVTLNKGVLTHEIKRRSHLEVSLPYFSSTLDHISQSFAEGEAVDAVDGRLWVFNLKASDVVKKKTSMSRLSIAMQMTKKPGIRQFTEEDHEYNYTLRLIKKNARREYLEDKLEVLVNEYLASEFSGEGKQSFSTYLTDLDKALDEKDIPGSNEFGDILIGLDVNVPEKALSAWKKVPTEKNDPVYTLMSECVQKFLRRYIPYCYFQESEQFDNLMAAYPLLVYSALPPLYKVQLKSGNQLILIDGIVPEWEFQESDLRNEVLSQLCAPRLLEVILPRVHKQLQGMPDQLANYKSSLIGKMISLKQPHTKGFFEGLMIFESDLIKKIHKACQNLRKHLDAQNLEDAVESLAKFGDTLTQAFHEDLNSIYAGSTLRSLSPLLFIEVTKVFDKKLADKLTPTAMLELMILPKQSPFPLEDYFKGKKPAPSEVALQQRIINLGTLSP
jgi:hypothetical protein